MLAQQMMSKGQMPPGGLTPQQQQQVIKYVHTNRVHSCPYRY